MKASFTDPQILDAIYKLPKALTHDAGAILGFAVDTKQYGSENIFVLRIAESSYVSSKKMTSHCCSEWDTLLKITDYENKWQPQTIDVPGIDSAIARKFPKIMVRGTNFISVDDLICTFRLEKHFIYMAIFKKICRLVSKYIKKYGSFKLYSTKESPAFSSLEEMMIWIDMNG